MHTRNMIRTALFSLGMFVTAVMASATWAQAEPAASIKAKKSATGNSPAGTRPNFVFILIDDLRHDALGCTGHPFAKTPNIDRIAAGGVRFTNAFVTTSLCSPARGSFLTGMYAHKHGVRTNDGEDLDPKTPTFPQVLRINGYETALIGKWHMGESGDPRPGFDYWLGLHGQGTYLDPVLNENGCDIHTKGYATDLLTDYAVKWLEKPRSKPFCLYLSHKATHDDWIPAERHKDLYSDVKFTEPASYKDDLSGKPEWMRMIKLRGGKLKRPAPPVIPDRLTPPPWSEDPADHEKKVNYNRTLASADDSVGRVLDTLQKNGLLENTLVIFAGDNGFFQGEHGGMGDKRLAYEESMRIPLFAMGPGVPRGKLLDPMVLNIDLAPTLLELAGAPIPLAMQGKSLTPVLAGKTTRWRDSFIYEYYREEWLPGMPTMLGVRTHDWKYVCYPELDDIDELYDLKADPFEMNNLATNPAYKDQLTKMQAELDRLCKETGRTPRPAGKKAGA